MIGSSSHLLVLMLLIGVIGGCAKETGRPVGGPLSEQGLDAWGAETAAAPEPEAGPAPTRASIELAGGDRLEAFVALVRFDADAAPVCGLYVLRAHGGRLEEGRRSVDCPADGLASLDAGGVRHRPVEEPRLAQLRSALSGARAVSDRPGAGDDAVEHIVVRVITDRRTVEGTAAPAEWPSPIEGRPDPAYARAPANLTELYEAVMYPHRYAR